jgi:hypothetical protein
LERFNRGNNRLAKLRVNTSGLIPTGVLRIIAIAKDNFLKRSTFSTCKSMIVQIKMNMNEQTVDILK